MLLRLICYIAYCFLSKDLNPLSASLTKWSNTLKQFVGNLTTNCLSVFDQFVGLALKGLKKSDVIVNEATRTVNGTEIAIFFAHFRPIVHLHSH